MVFGDWGLGLQSIGFGVYGLGFILQGLGMGVAD